MYNTYPAYYPQPRPNALPQQQVIQVNGKASVDTIQLAPNSSILLMDTTAPMVWLCVSDGVGRATATPYDICEHKDPAPAQAPDMTSRFDALEARIAKMEERMHAYEPDDADA